MRTHIIEGKPKKTVTIEVDGHSLTLTEGVEVTVIVVVASQQPLAPDGAVCPAHQTYFEADGTCAIVGCEYTRPAGKA